jgi:hypothetical protein
MGYTTIARAKQQGNLIPTGSKKLEADMGTWLKLSTFAKVKKLVA